GGARKLQDGLAHGRAEQRGREGRARVGSVPEEAAEALPESEGAKLVRGGEGVHGGLGTPPPQGEQALGVAPVFREGGRTDAQGARFGHVAEDALVQEEGSEAVGLREEHPELRALERGE